MKILIPIDIAFPHEDLVDHVSWILPVKDSEIMLLYVKEVYPTYERAISSVSAFPDDWSKLLDEKAMQFFAPIKEKLEGAGARVGTRVISGIPENVIADVTKQEEIDYTVIAPRLHSKIESFIWGSTSNKIRNLNHGSTLILRDHHGHDKLEHVLFGYDGSKQAAFAMKRAINRLKLKENKVKVTVANILSIPPAISLISPSGVMSAIATNLKMEGEVVIAEALKTLKEMGIEDYDSKVFMGEPATKLMALAETIDAQLIVIGAQGHSTIEHAIMGSVADRITTHAKCSVLMMREPPE